MKRCPACSAPLFRKRFGEVALDGCMSCGGVFFDGGELSVLAKSPESLREADRAFRPGMQPAVAAERTDACPGCGERLVQGEHPSFSGIAMAMCGQCKGVFLEHGAGLALAERLAPTARVELSAAATPSPADADPTSTAHLPVVRGELVARDLAGESGFGASFARGVRFFGAAFALARECPKLLAPIYLGIAVNLLLLGLIVLAVLAMLPAGALENEAIADAWLRDEYVAVVALGLGSGLCGSFVTYAAMGMTVSGVDAFLKGRTPELGVALRDVLKNAGGILALAIVSWLVELLVGALRGRRRGNLIGSMLARAVEAAWTVLSFLLLPVIMVEDVGLLAALRRVRDIHRENLLTIAASEIGIRLVLGLAGLAFGVLAAAVVYLAQPTSASAIITLIAVFAFAAVVLNGFATYLRATYYTCLYLWAVAVEREPAASQLRAPGPLAAAMG
jgi:Zn-finger nucleic acid-binding protein